MDSANKRLGRNPLSSLTRKDEAILEVIDKLEERCTRLKCFEKQYYCESPRSRQRGLLGTNWQEKCRKCHVGEMKAEYKPIKSIPPRVMNKLFGALFASFAE